MKLRHSFFAFAAASALLAGPAFATDLAIVSGSTGNDIDVLRSQLDVYEKKSGNKVTIVPMPSSTTDQFGQYKLWLAAQNSDIDVYQTDVIWAPQLANQFVDLTDAAKDVVKDHFPAIVESQTVNGKLVALPLFTDAPALYLPQGPPRQVRRQGADDVEGDGRHRQDDHGQGARRRQQGHVGLRLPGQRL